MAAEAKPLDISGIFTPSRIFHPPDNGFERHEWHQPESFSIVWEKSCSSEIPMLSLSQYESIIVRVLLQPEYLSPIVARADIVSDCPGTDTCDTDIGFVGEFLGFQVSRRLIVKNIPRNPMKDRAVDESIWVFERIVDDSHNGILIVVVPHVSPGIAELPFYFPDTKAIAIEVSGSMLSIHRLAQTISSPGFSSADWKDEDRTQRMLKRLLEVLTKRLRAPDYVKRVHHDNVVPREKYQDVYQKLKAKYADQLCQLFASSGYEGKGCREVDKIFEELGIASFCICLWEEMYGPQTSQEGTKLEKDEPGTNSSPTVDASFVGFVDLGCGSGVLTYVLRREGWPGYGFDARKRKIWKLFDPDVASCLIESTLLPSAIDGSITFTSSAITISNPIPSSGLYIGEEGPAGYPSPLYTVPGSTKIYHSGVFPERTFLICNHGDELTAWTPLLAALSKCPFVIIPCCSFDLAGRKFRAATRKQLCQGQQQRRELKRSTYQSLIDYIENLSVEVGFKIEKEWLRIPSTRNLAILGTVSPMSGKNSCEPLVKKIIRREGGEGWVAMVTANKETEILESNNVTDQADH
ncbi:tRNA(Ser) Um(44) 2'-O-methyltransferase [Orbilia ellipsospora]|uniref:tRNA (uracil-O(2)-)-methyltransferase n=1 Tax=Orbilia ellipsospora TaxID=2528407 RepID=A0AAV9X7D2_9PEZI